MHVEDIKVFVPSKDYETSKRFYQALGFEISYETDDAVEMLNGECSFYLQDFYHEQLANNLMMQLVVSSIDRVHETLESLSGFDIRYKAPAQVPWGKVLYLWGPAGELWHITEFSRSS